MILRTPKLLLNPEALRDKDSEQKRDLDRFQGGGLVKPDVTQLYEQFGISTRKSLDTGCCFSAKPSAQKGHTPCKLPSAAMKMMVFNSPSHSVPHS